MHHIIPDAQIAEALYLFSLVDPASFLFLFFRAKNITLGDDHKLDQRVFVSPLHLTVSRHDLTRLYFSGKIVAVVAV